MYAHAFVQVAGGFSALFLLIFLLQGLRIRKDRIRSDEAAQEAAAVKRFEEIFQISPHADVGEVKAHIRTVIAGLNLLLIRHLDQYELNRALRVEAIMLAERFGFRVTSARETHEQRRARRRRLTTSSRQTGAADSAA